MTAPVTPLADSILTIVHAFPDEGRKAGIRALSAQVQAVETERDTLATEVDRLRAKVEDLQEHAQMACEAPQDGCDCAGCSYARERGGA